MEQKILSLPNITIDINLQPRINGLDSDHIRELEECPEGWPPLVVVKNNGSYILVDGFHRFSAAQNLELENIAVQVIDTPPDNDLKAIAFALNAIHGKPLSLNDRRAEAERLLRRDPSITNMEIARRSGLSNTTIAFIRNMLEEELVIQPVQVRKTVTGHNYTVSQSYHRKLGELPELNMADILGNTTDKSFNRKGRIEQRKIVKYLTQLSHALKDMDKLEGWGVADDAAEACKILLDEEKLKVLMNALEVYCNNVLAVVRIIKND